MNLTGQLITLDRAYPLVRIDGLDLRAEYATSFSRDDHRVTVGDYLTLVQTDADALPQITGKMERDTLLARRICIEHPSLSEGGDGKYEEHLLAANFDRVFIVHALGRQRLDLDYLERQLVAAFESGGSVAVILNKADITTQAIDDVIAEVRSLADELDVIACSVTTGQGIEQLKTLCPTGSMSVFFGRSGVGKSSLINALIGSEELLTAEVRQRDQAGRHTTVARQIIFADGRAYYDTPGLRSIGNYLSEVGLETVFSDVIDIAAQCRFRDCRHENEPGCAVSVALDDKTLTERRLRSYRTLVAEVSGDDQLRE